MKPISILFSALILSNICFANECTEELAINIAIKEIAKSFPENWQTFEPYYAETSEGSSFIIQGALQNGTRGGTPVAVVTKNNCEVTSVYHTQ